MVGSEMMDWLKKIIQIDELIQSNSLAPVGWRKFIRILSKNFPSNLNLNNEIFSLEKVTENGPPFWTGVNKSEVVSCPK